MRKLITVRRAATATASLAAGALLLSACAGAPAPSNSDGEVEGSTIVLQTINGLLPQFQKIAEAYAEQYPDRKVEVRATTDDANAYAQQLSTANLSDSMPDVFFNVDFLADTLAKNGVTLDLAGGLADGKLGGITADDFLPQFLGQYRPVADPEKITGLPVSADSTALFYNTALFEKYGVTDLPTAEWTWEDMYEAAEQIRDASDGAVIGLDAPNGVGANQIVYGPVIDAFGGYVYDPETGKTGIGEPAAIDAWTLLLSAYGSASGDYSTTASETESFAAGNVAMRIGSRAEVQAYQKALVGTDWNVEILPTVNGGSTTGGGSYGLSIASTSKNQSAAWAFLAWFYDPESGLKVVQDEAGAIPPTSEGIDTGTWKDITPPPANIAIFGDSARNAVLLAQLPGGTGGVLSDAVTKATQQVVLEDRDVTEAFEEAAATVQSALDEELSK